LRFGYITFTSREKERYQQITEDCLAQALSLHLPVDKVLVTSNTKTNHRRKSNASGEELPLISLTES
jgi:hypothetical protein